MISDLLLYLVVIIIILGMIVYFSAIINDNQVSNVNNKELNNYLDTLTSLLVETSGKPDNWEKLNTMSGVCSVGLKSTTSSLISYDKLVKLKENSFLLDNVLPSGVYYSVSITQEGQQPIFIAGSSTLSDKKNIQTRQVPIIIDYGFQIMGKDNNNHEYTCPYNHDNNTWKCRIINLNQSSLNEGKYYILTKKPTQITISNTYQENITKTCNNKLNINPQLQQLQQNTNQTIYIHFKSKDNDIYIVYDKNNREKFLDTIIQPETNTLEIKTANWKEKNGEK